MARPRGAARRRTAAGVALLLAAASSAGAASAAEAPPPPSVVLEHPVDGLVASTGPCGLFVAGRVGPPALDVIVALDTSVSTAAPSGVDVDRDGETGASRFGRVGFTMGERSSDPDDSVLAAEVAAARRLVARLDLRRSRVGLVGFSGGPADLVRGEPVLEDAVTLVPLSSDPAKIAAGLDALLAETPAGGTHMGAGVDQATIELLGLEGAASQSEPTHARRLVLFTDGTPTLPYGPDRPGDNVRATLAAADRAHKARVRVFSVALGAEALERPVAAVEIAERTGGRFLPVPDAASLDAVMDALELEPEVTLELRNATRDEPALALRTSADGSFGGFVPLSPGVNRVEARVRDAEGGEASARLEVTRDDDAPPAPVPREFDFLDDGRGAFAACLDQVPRVDLRAEALRREQMRRQLLLEMERERARARERAAAQRKELELEAESP